MATEEVIIQVRTNVDDSQLKQLEAELTRIGQKAQSGAGGVSQFETEVRKTNQTSKNSSSSTKQFSDNVKKSGDNAGGAATKVKKVGDETKKAGANARSAGKSFGIMSGALSMVGGMVFYDLASGITQSAQASLKGMQSLQSYGRMIGMTSQEVSAYQTELSRLQQTYKKVDMTAIGAEVQKTSKMYGLGKDNLVELSETYAVASSAFQMNGRTQEDSILAVNDALDGEFRRLKEIGISQDDLKNNGWNGDLSDKRSLIDALNKTLQQRGFDDFAKSISNSSEAMQSIQMSIGQLIAVLFNQLSPLLIPVANGIFEITTALTTFLQTPAGSQIASIVVGFMGVVVGAYAVARGIQSARNAFKTMSDSVQIVRNGLSGLGWVTDAERAKRDADTAATNRNTTAQNKNNSAIRRSISSLKTKATAWIQETARKVSNTAKNYAHAISERVSMSAIKAKTLSLYSSLKSYALSTAAKIKSIAKNFAEMAAKIANTIVTYALALAEWLLASPILIVVIAVVALIAILWYLYNTNDTVRAGIDWLIQTIWNFLNSIWSAITGAISAITSWATGAWQWLQNSWNAFLSFLGYLASFPGRVWQWLLAAINRVKNFASQVISRMKSSAKNAVTGFINGIMNLAGKVWDELSKTLDRVMEWGSQIVSKMGEIAQQAWQAFIGGLGIGSPGYIQILTLKELDDTARRIPESMPTAIRNLENYATGMVEAYGTPEFPIGELTAPIPVTTMTGANMMTPNSNEIVNNVTINVGSVDSEDRIDEIAEAVTRIFTFNNITAGRSI